MIIYLQIKLDCNIVWTQQRMTIKGELMRIQALTPTLTPEEETPILSVCFLLPGFYGIALCKFSSNLCSKLLAKYYI